MVPNSALPPDEHPPKPMTATALLRAAIATRWRDGAVAGDGLDAVVAAFVEEARSVGLRAEQVVVALKVLERDVLEHTLRVDDTETRRRFREWLVTTCVRAYYQR